MRTLAIALIGSAALTIPAAAQAQNPLSSIFNCDAAGNRDTTGAVIGGVLGGVLGNSIADDNETIGTVLGAAIGAAAGSYLGCQMSGNDVTRAEDATRIALSQNRSTTWTNAQTGASGRIDIVNTFRRADVGARVPDPYYRPRSLSEVSFARGVQYPVSYDLTSGTYAARTRTNVRSAPSMNAPVLTQLSAGQTFDAIARVGNGDWYLASRNGTAIGYVSASVVSYAGYGDTYAYNDSYNNRYPNDRYDDRYADSQWRGGELCRTFDQTVQYRGGYGRTTERFTACQNTRGEWVIVS